MYVSWKNVVKLSDAEIGSAQNTVVVKKQGQVTNSNLEETSYYYSTISIQLTVTRLDAFSMRRSELL